MPAVEPIRTPEQREQFKYLLSQVRGGQLYRDLFIIGSNTGLRISDLLALTLEQARCINPERPNLDIIEIKTGKPKTLTMNSAVMEVITRRLQERPSDVWLFQSPFYKRGKNDPVAISRRAVGRILSEAGAKVVPKVHASKSFNAKNLGICHL